MLSAVTKSCNHNYTDARAIVNFINRNTIDSLVQLEQPKGKWSSQKVSQWPFHAEPTPDPMNKPPWPSGLTVHEHLTTLKRRKSSVIDIPVSNTTQHGRLQLVRSVTSMDVKLEDEEDGASIGTPETRTKSARQPVEPINVHRREWYTSGIRSPELECLDIRPTTRGNQDVMPGSRGFRERWRGHWMRWRTSNEHSFNW